MKISPCTKVNGEDPMNKISDQMDLNLSPLNVTNRNEEPSLNSESKDAKTSVMLHDSEDAILSTANDVTVHNDEPSLDISNHESDVDNASTKNANIKDQPSTQDVLLGDPTKTKLEDHENGLERPCFRQHSR